MPLRGIRAIANSSDEGRQGGGLTNIGLPRTADRGKGRPSRAGSIASIAGATGLSILLGLALIAGWLLFRASAMPASFAAPPGWTADVALVMSGDARDLRTLRAVELLTAGRVRRILITGSGFGGDSAEYLAQIALAHGAQPADLLIERHATTTWENMALSRPLLEGAAAKRVLVVTSFAHARRAALTAEAVLQGFELKVETVDDLDRSAGTRARELLKELRYAALGRIPWSAVFRVD